MSIYIPIYNSASKNSLYAFIWTSLGIFITTLIGPLIFHKMSALDWALYSFFLLCVAVLIFIESSIQSYVQIESSVAVLKRENYYPFEDISLKNLVLGTILLSICCSSFALLLPPSDYLWWCFLLSTIHIIPRLILAIAKGVILSRNDQTKFYFLSSASNIFRSFLVLLFILMNTKVADLIKVYIFYSFMEACFFIWHSGISFLGISPWSSLKKKAGLSLNKKLLYTILGSNLVSVLSANIDKVSAFVLFEFQLAGEYTLAASIASLLYISVNSSVTSYTPSYIELLRNKEWTALKESLFRTSAINNMISMIILCGCFIFSEYICNLVSLKLDIAYFIQNLFYLLLGVYFLSNLWLFGCISNCMKKPHMALFTNLTFIISFTSIVSLLVNLYPTVPLAKAFLGASIMTFVINLLYFKKRIMEFNMYSYLKICLVLPLSISGLLSIPIVLIGLYSKLLSFIMLPLYAYAIYYTITTNQFLKAFIARPIKEIS